MIAYILIQQSTFFFIETAIKINWLIFVKISLRTPIVNISSKIELETTANDHNMDGAHRVKETSLIGVAVAFSFVGCGNLKCFFDRKIWRIV